MEEQNIAEAHLRKKKLEEDLSSLGKVAVAFSSGVDSAFLLKVAHDVLGNNAIALTASACFFPGKELEEAKAFCKEEGIRHIVVEFDGLGVPDFKDNPPDRCYVCKRALFTCMTGAANEAGFDIIVEGSNTDDTGDYRPGMRAISELGIRSPLKDAGLSKNDIRMLSKELGLYTWDKPSYACLASRFVYGEQITEDKLRMVELAEQRLHEMGFRQVRVRIHDRMARIETLPSDLERIANRETASVLNEYLKELGFEYVTLDLGGYVMGSMNRPLLDH
ncbi:MAG: ATP-dependent sacrificial sulfur transferase LarE [Lachnospiraceae bacterium]|nr:ATP-dependent sacrificial sulfur transferase LarE [Lachnospiraceae bacterium]